MADDPDAMRHPGSEAPRPRRSDPPQEVSPTRGDLVSTAADPAETLADRFQPATGRRRVFRVPTGVVEPTAAVAPEIIASDGWVVERDGSDPGDAAGRRGWRRAGLVALGVSALVVAAVVVRALADDEQPRRPVPGELTAADERRLPAAVEELWSTTLNGTGNATASSVAVNGRSLVVAVVDDGSRNRSRVVGLEAMSGRVRWGRSFTFAPPEVSILGVFGGVLVLEQTDPVNRRLIGMSTANGDTVWERRVAGSSINSVLLGTELIANFQPEIPDRTTFYDPITGAPAGEIIGDLATTDLSGTWYFTRGFDILSINLLDGWSEPVLLVDDGPTLGDVMAVVDDRIIVAGLRGQLSEVSPHSDLLIPIGGDRLPPITGMFPSGGSSLVASNDSEIFGVELVDEQARLTWKRDASMRGFAPTERGMVLRISDAGIGFADAVDLLVVDGVTGKRLAGAPGFDGVEKLPLIVGDGFVTITEVVEGDERRAYDLEGNELWRLVVDGKLRVGDRIIVVLDNTDAGFRLTAYGAPA